MKLTLSLIALIPFIGLFFAAWIINIPPLQPAQLQNRGPRGDFLHDFLSDNARRNKKPKRKEKPAKWLWATTQINSTTSESAKENIETKSSVSKWTKAKILISIFILLTVILVSFDYIDPPYSTNKVVSATVKQSAQVFPYFKKPYNRTVIELNNGQLLTITTSLNDGLRPGDSVTLEVRKRRISGLITYKYGH